MLDRDAILNGVLAEYPPLPHAELLACFLMLDNVQGMEKWLQPALQTANADSPVRQCLEQTRLLLDEQVHIFPYGDDDPAPDCWDTAVIPACTLTKQQFVAIYNAYDAAVTQAIAAL